MALEVALDLHAAFHGTLTFGLEDFAVSWSEKTKKAVREKFANSVKAAAEAGAVFTLIPERLSGFSTTIEVEDELILLMRDLLFKSGSRNPQQAFLANPKKIIFQTQ